MAWEDEASLLDEVGSAGPGGTFFESPSTLRLLRTGYHTSRVFPHYGLEKWQELGRPAAEARLRERTMDLLRSASPPEDRDHVIERGEAWIRARLP